MKNSIRLKEDHDDAWWFYLAKHHNTIFDIGCNVGYMSLLALIQKPNRNILLVDPNPKALSKAAVHLITNGFESHAQFLSAFVSNTVNETVPFYSIESGAAGSMYASHAKSAAAIGAVSEVKTVTLDYLYETYKLKPDLVKIDVEGAETLVMQSAKKLAAACQCTFFVEMHNLENLGMEAAAQKMMDWCDEVEYQAWYLASGKLLETAKEVSDRGKCHLLLLPKSESYPVYLQGIKQSAKLPKSI
jgi:FkbM family methyltransferase